uniref:Uncharacterized protein n=1 Tax=Setaria viridis TaxID=4556 RepID=A0A4U6SXW4_SETVI|nr:hypothetical protein SEVIR_9G219900v2 [Setaria viridis]
MASNLDQCHQYKSLPSCRYTSHHEPPWKHQWLQENTHLKNSEQPSSLGFFHADLSKHMS